MNLLLERLLEGHDISQAEAGAVMRALASPDTHAALKGALLAALRAKGETADEVRGFALAMRDAALPFPTSGRCIDIVGTGGDGSNSINLSTAASLATAALGLPVVKHGNRSVSSASGSADVLEALGVRLPESPAQAQALFARTGWTFLFAPVFHPAMRGVVPVRRAMKVRTVFNLLGPLTNPARPPLQLLGAWSPQAAAMMAEAVSGMPGLERAYVVHGSPGWDEATPVGPFQLWDVRPGRVEARVENPSDWGVARCTPQELVGGDAAHNAAALRAVFGGAAGPQADAVRLNVALACSLAGDSRQQAIARAATIGDGVVAAYLSTVTQV